MIHIKIILFFEIHNFWISSEPEFIIIIHDPRKLKLVYP